MSRYKMDRNIQAHATVDKSLESTRRMMASMYETEEVGNKTLGMLHDQGEQLNRIEDGMETVNKDMREAEKHLTALERCCGCCTCPGSKVANFEDTDKYQSTWTKTEETVVTGQPTSSGSYNSGPGSGVTREQKSVGGNQAMIQKITGDEREDEMEQNLQAVSGLLSGLKNMALDMGDTIESQNTQIDRINQKAEQNELRVDSANKRAEKMLTSDKKKKK